MFYCLRRFCTFVLLASGVICAVTGCDTTQSVSLDSSTISTQKAEVPQAGTEIKPSKPTATETNADANAASKPVVAATQEASERLNQIEKPAAQPSAEKPQSTSAKPTEIEQPAIAAPAIVAPTVEQLAKWKQPEFEQLLLLDRKEKVEEIAFVAHVESSANGEWYALGGDRLTLWKAMADKPIATLWDLKMSAKSESVKSLAMDPTATWIAAGDGDGTLRIWNLSDQKEVTAKKIYNNDVIQIAVSDDGQEIATATYGKVISIWNAKTLEQKNKFEINTNGLSRILYAGPGKLVVAGQSLTIWDTATGALEKTLIEKGYAASLARSPDLSVFVYADEENMHVLSSSDQSEVKKIKGNFARNEMIKFTNDGKYIWTANGSSVRCWDRAVGRVLQHIDANKPEVAGVTWVDDSNLLRVITEDGAIWYWGTVSNGQSAGLKPLHSPIELADDRNEPGTAAELKSIIDLRELPLPPDSNAKSGEATMLQFDSGNSIEDTKAFYRYVFDQRGWKEIPGNVATPDYLTFKRKGFRVFISISDAGNGRATIYLANLGDVSLKALPKLDLPGLTLSYEDDSNCSYEVESDLLTIETQLLKKLSEAGWLPYARLNSSHTERAESRSLEFIRNAVTLRVGVRSKDADPSKFTVQYSTFVALSHLPVPQDCDFIECDVVRSPALVAKTSLSLEDCHAFYDQAMAKQGWLVSGVSKSTKDDFRWLTYFRNLNEVQIRISRVEEGGCWIVVGEYALQNTWQIPKKEDVAKDKSKPQKPGIEAADVPIYKQAEATSVQFDDQQKRIEIKIPKNSHIEIVDFYAAKFAELGWKEKPNGFRAEDYAFVTFTKENASVDVRVNSSSLGTTIGISDDGLLWNKAPTEAKRIISYEGWLRKNKHPATLRLLDTYIQAMSN